MTKLLLLILSAGLSACTTAPRPHEQISYASAPTPYVPFDPSSRSSVFDGEWGYGGYFSKDMGFGYYMVGFLGNSGTSPKTARDSAQYRAAEVTLNSGYRYFRIISSESGQPEMLPSGRWIQFPSSVYTIQCHNDFRDDSIDAAQLKAAIGTAYQS
jgi:hypothetical protein